MFYSHFTDEKVLSSEQVLMTVLKKKKNYYLMAEGIIADKSFVKILTHYKNYFLTVSTKEINNYKTLLVDEKFFISVSQFSAFANQKCQLNKNLARCLKCLLNEQKKISAVNQLQQVFSQNAADAHKLLAFKKKKRFYLKLSAIDATREGLDWATMPLLLFWIPISFANLAMISLMILIAVTAIVTLTVALYTIQQQYQNDKNELKKLTKDLVHDPLALPQLKDLTFSKNFALPAFVTATTLFSFFWVTYDMLTVLGIISTTSMPILPLIVIPVCGVVSMIFAGLHFYKLTIENQLYEKICGEENDCFLELSPLKIPNPRS